MDGNTIPISENTTVIVKSSGDLFLQGIEQGEVRFQSGEDRIRVNQSNDNLYIETHASLDISVPQQANVIVEKVGGSAFLTDLQSSLVVQKIGGDLALQRMNNVRIEKVGGGCLIEGVSDSIVIHKIGGDLTLRQAAGSVEVNMVGGEIDIQMIGGAVSARAGGNLKLYITEDLGGPVSLRAGGSAELYVPSNVNAEFVLNSSAQSIALVLRNQSQQMVDDMDAGHFQFSLGGGEQRVELRTGGDMRVSDESREPESITGELERRENAWKEARERRGHPSWSGGFGFDRTSAWADMISRRAQEAARRAEQRAQSAMRRTEDQIRQAAEREIHRSEWRGGGPRPPAPPAPSRPQRNAVTEQERLMVLQMLQENKISVDQAEKLLAALEGRFIE
jgi:hypothetical protein